MGKWLAFRVLVAYALLAGRDRDGEVSGDEDEPTVVIVVPSRSPFVAPDCDLARGYVHAIYPSARWD